jgi:hypothetical protein
MGYVTSHQTARMLFLNYLHFPDKHHETWNVPNLRGHAGSASGWYTFSKSGKLQNQNNSTIRKAKPVMYFAKIAKNLKIEF